MLIHLPSTSIAKILFEMRSNTLLRSDVRLVQGTPVTFYFKEDVRAVIQIFMEK